MLKDLRNWILTLILLATAGIMAMYLFTFKLLYFGPEWASKRQRMWLGEVNTSENVEFLRTQVVETNQRYLNVLDKHHLYGAQMRWVLSACLVLLLASLVLVFIHKRRNKYA